MTGTEREALVDSLLIALDQGQISQGQLLKQLRVQLTGMSQGEYANLVGVSRRTLSQIERNEANPSLETITRVYRPFSIKMTLVPRKGSY